jgi:hypothetical protein
VEIDGSEKSVLTDSKGYFELADVKSSVCTIKISKDSYLMRIIKDVPVSTVIGSSDAPIDIWVGDISINGVQNNAINMADIMVVAKSFNSASGDSKYSKNLDLNLDNAINLADIMIMAKHFNKSTSSYADITFSE